MKPLTVKPYIVYDFSALISHDSPKAKPRELYPLRGSCSTVKSLDDSFYTLSPRILRKLIPGPRLHPLAMGVVPALLKRITNDTH